MSEGEGKQGLAVSARLRRRARSHLVPGRARQPRLHQAAGERHPFANAVAIVALNKDNTVIAFGSPFVQVSTVADSKRPPSPLRTPSPLRRSSSTHPGKFDAENFRAPTLEYVLREGGQHRGPRPHVPGPERGCQHLVRGLRRCSFGRARLRHGLRRQGVVLRPPHLEGVPYPTDGFETLTDPQDPSGTAGNAVYLHLCVDALALQPCDPTFVGAGDACIQADANRYGYGCANKCLCLLWNALASRGLGVKAANFDDDSSVPM